MRRVGGIPLSRPQSRCHLLLSAKKKATIDYVRFDFLCRARLTNGRLNLRSRKRNLWDLNRITPCEIKFISNGILAMSIESKSLSKTNQSNLTFAIALNRHAKVCMERLKSFEWLCVDSRLVPFVVSRKVCNDSNEKWSVCLRWKMSDS